MAENEDRKVLGAWVITDVWSKTGVRITVKASGDCTITALEDLYAGIAYGMAEHGWQTSAPDAPQAPKATVPMVDENGTPVVDGNGQPQTIPLPPGTNVYTVKELYHAKSKDGSKDMLKVITVESPYNTKYGVSCFNAPIQGWKDWPVDTRYAPPDGAKQVIIEDPKDGGKYANIKDFR